MNVQSNRTRFKDRSNLSSSPGQRQPGTCRQQLQIAGLNLHLIETTQGVARDVLYQWARARILEHAR